MKNQRGFINLDGLVTVFYLAAVGILAIFAGACYALYLVIQHFQFV